jgi:hypothetical protein
MPDRARPWNPLTMGYRFMAEAKRLWELRSRSCTIVKAQAATLLSMVYFHNGLDQIGHPYLREAVSLARELGIFDAATVQGDRDMNNARLVTAWGIFGWTVYAPRTLAPL